MLNPKLYATLTALLLASACSREGLELCDPADGEVSFEVLGQAAELEGLWIETEDTGTSRPMDVLFDAGGRPREIHTRGWREDGTSGSRHTFGCDGDHYPVSFPLIAGETNSHYGAGSWSGSIGRTLEEVVVEGDRLTLTYREFDPNNDDTIYFSRFSFEQLESGELAVTLNSRFEDQSWSEVNPAVLTRNPGA